MINKPVCVIQSPFETRSGYGDMARDIIRHIIELDLYDVKLISLPWGSTPKNALSSDDIELKKRILPEPVMLDKQPDIFIQISVPNEFSPMGKHFNIGITAGIETNAISAPWVFGCNRMDAIWTISNHSKAVIENTIIEERDQAGRILTRHKVTKPVEVLHNCVHTDIFKKIPTKNVPMSVMELLSEIPEKFCFLFVGHWLRGNVGEDRKNVGLLTKIFCELFKNTPRRYRPALILKTSGGTFSILDKEECIQKIQHIRQSCGPDAPSVYLIHGDLTEIELNGLYNHPKVKAHISLTKGEGFGRPLLEATMSEKPVIASGWSGQLDFLNPDEAILLPGELRKVDASSVWQDVILPESSWFNVDSNAVANAMMWVFNNPDQFTSKVAELAKKNRRDFSYSSIKHKTKELLDKYVGTVPVQAIPVLPTLKRVSTPTLPNLTIIK